MHLNFPFSLPFKTCRAGSIYCWLVSVAVGEIYYHTEETIKQQAAFEQQQQKTKEYGFLKKIMYLQDKLNKTY